MSDEIRESLRRAASGEPAIGDAFARFEAARRRAGIVRGVVIAVVAVALAMSFAFVFPNPFTSGRPANFQEGGPFEPQDEVVNLYQDQVVRYEVRYATGWGVRGEPGAPAVFVERPGDAFPVFVERDDRTGLDAPVQSFIRVTPIDRECFPRRVCEHPAPGDFADAGADVEALVGGEVAGRKVRAYLMEIPGSTDVASLSRSHVIPCVECALVSYWLNWNDRWIIRVDAVAVDEDALGELIPDADRFMSSLTDYVNRPFD